MKPLTDKIKVMKEGDVLCIPCESLKGARELAADVYNHLIELGSHDIQVHPFCDNAKTDAGTYVRYQVLLHKGKVDVYDNQSYASAPGATCEVQTAKDVICTGVYRWKPPLSLTRFDSHHSITMLDGTVIRWRPYNVEGIRHSYTQRHMVCWILKEVT